MRPLFICGLLILLTLAARSQKSDEQIIRDILGQQTLAWNSGDLDKFLVGYWPNDSLMYIGKKGITYGYEQTLKQYRQSYPDTATMGKLSFDILHVNRISTDAFFVAGKWSLKRTAGDLSGHFTLVFRKLKNKWLIVSDHSS